MPNPIRNISPIVKNDYCISCGACEQVCTKNAIKYVFRDGLFKPVIDQKKCINCGACTKICPSNAIDIPSTYGILDIENESPIKCFTGFSTDEKIRANSTSGGVATTLVKELLEKQEYEKAFLLEYNNFQGQAKLKATYNAQDVIKSAKSKYIPASIENVIIAIKNNEIDNSIIVATPCQILAIKRVLHFFKRNEGRILFIGLFCDKTLNYNIYSFYRFAYGKYSSLYFRDKRGGNWPGNTIIEKKKGPKEIDRAIRMSLKPYFQLNRCRFCFDKLNQLADISIGDCYIEGSEDSKGASSIIVRTELGNKILNTTQSLTLHPSNFDEIKKSQFLSNKRINLKRNYVAQSAYNAIPQALISDINLNTDQEEKDCSMLRLGKSVNSRRNYWVFKLKKNLLDSKTVHILKRLLHLIWYPDNGYYIYLSCAGFVNKGDHLMRDAVIDQIKQHIPHATITVPESVFYEDPSYCKKNNLLPLQPYQSLPVRTIKRFIYRNIFNRNICIYPEQISLFFDASGFKYTDQFRANATTLEQTRNFFKLFTKKSLCVIFLPQAFGPFNFPESKEMIRLVHNFANTIYARDSVSYNHLKHEFPNSKKIKIAPDFTALCKPLNDSSIQLKPKSYVVIIPNARMVTHTSEDISSKYLDFMNQIVKDLQEKNEHVVLLNHEGKDDEILINKINKTFNSDLTAITNLNGLAVKYIIKNSKLTISSRFHGVVSGLTENVPTLCTSWSHKYAELLKEHQCESNMLDINDVTQALKIVNDALHNPEKYSSNKECNTLILSKIQTMWNDIWDFISIP